MCTGQLAAEDESQWLRYGHCKGGAWRICCSSHAHPRKSLHEKIWVPPRDGQVHLVGLLIPSTATDKNIIITRNVKVL